MRCSLPVGCLIDHVNPNVTLLSHCDTFLVIVKIEKDDTFYLRNKNNTNNLGVDFFILHTMTMFKRRSAGIQQEFRRRSVVDASSHKLNTTICVRTCDMYLSYTGSCMYGHIQLPQVCAHVFTVFINKTYGIQTRQPCKVNLGLMNFIGKI